MSAINNKDGKIRKKKYNLSREEALSAVPVRNKMVSERENDDGTLILVLPRRRTLSYRLLSLIFTIPKERKLSLDDIGRWVWEKCDGEHTAGDIIEQLSKDFNISRKEAEVSLLSFLKDMSKKKLIGFVLADRDNDYSDS